MVKRIVDTGPQFATVSQGQVEAGLNAKADKDRRMEPYLTLEAFDALNADVARLEANEQSLNDAAQADKREIAEFRTALIEAGRAYANGHDENLRLILCDINAGANTQKIAEERDREQQAIGMELLLADQREPRSVWDGMGYPPTSKDFITAHRTGDKP